MTRGVFFRAFVAAVIALFVVQGYVVYQQGELARQGAETHVAMCAYKADLAQRASASARFLTLTRAQIRREYGEGFVKIPKATIAASLHSERSALASLDKLTCK